MLLYMTEIVVADFDGALAWFRDRLGVPVELNDPARRFALLGTAKGRIGLTAQKPGGFAVLPRLTFLVEDLGEVRARLIGLGPTAIVEDQAERFQSFRLEGPEGIPITVFAWTASQDQA